MAFPGREHLRRVDHGIDHAHRVDGQVALGEGEEHGGSARADPQQAQGGLGDREGAAQFGDCPGQFGGGLLHDGAVQPGQVVLLAEAVDLGDSALGKPVAEEGEPEVEPPGGQSEQRQCSGEGGFTARGFEGVQADDHRRGPGRVGRREREIGHSGGDPGQRFGKCAVGYH